MEQVVERNNTSFYKQLYETIKSITKDKSDALKYHQRITHDYLLKYPHVRGILAYHEMGAGKSILAAAVCESVLQSGVLRKVIFISTKSLHDNFVENVKKYLIMLNGPESFDEDNFAKHIKSNYKFISLNASNMLQQVYNAVGVEEDSFMGFDDSEPINIAGKLDDHFIVMDEAHNFFNSITNGSKNAVGLYNMIMDATNIKLLFLTGSPITNDPFEAAVCYNMCNGYIKMGPGKKDIATLFGTDYSDFTRYFVSDPDLLYVDKSIKPEEKTPPLTIKHADKFTNRIAGLTSYYGTDQAEIKYLFPKLYDPIVEKIPMSIKQYAEYAAARDKEIEETKRGFFKGKSMPLQKPKGTSSSYRVRSRQISNFLYPKYASNITKDEKGFLKYEKFIDKLTDETFKLGENGIEVYSPKFVKMLINLAIHLPTGILDDFKKLAKTKEYEPELYKSKRAPGIGPGIVYSQFVDSGIGVLAKALEHFGLVQITGAQDMLESKASSKGRFAIISGEVDPEVRTELIKLFTNPKNTKGEILAILLITSTGAEGISTKFVRHVHVMEPFWHWSRIEQVFARAARMGSHVDLPENERDVQPYIYLSNYPANIFDDKALAKKVLEQADSDEIQSVDTEALKREETTDITLYHKSLQNQLLINSFLQVMKESSIDCMIHYSTTLKCRVCHPTNEPLYLNDLDKDILSPSPCKPLQEQKIIAKSIVLETDTGKKEYMYYIDPEKNIHILQFNQILNGYQEIFGDHGDYDILTEKIKKVSKL